MFWRWIWRVLAIVATGSVAWVAYTLTTIARSEQIKPIAAGQPLVNGFDVVAVQLNILTVALTALGIALAIAALFGYQGVKEAAAAMARRMASQVADEVATAVVAEHIEKMEVWKRGFTAMLPDQNVDPGKSVEMRGDESDGRDSGGGGGDQASPAKRARPNRRNRSGPGN